MDTAHIRSANRANLMRLLLSRQAVTRTSLARATGLTRMTVGTIVEELKAAGLISELTRRNVATGRPSGLLRVDPHSPVVCGVFVSPEGLHGGVADFGLRLLGVRRLLWEEQETAASVILKLTRFVEDCRARYQRPFAGVGIAADAQVDSSGDLVELPDFFGIDRLAVVDHLTSQLSLPVITTESLGGTALAEVTYGIGTRLPSFGAISLFDRIGLALVQDGELVGTPRVDGFGHVTVDRLGRACRCGNRGCLEEYIGNRAIMGLVSAVTGEHYHRVEQAYAAAQHNAHARAVVLDGLDALATALAGISTTTGITDYVLQHDGTHLPQEFVAFLESRISARLGSEEARLHMSAFGDGANYHGAAAAVLAAVMTGEIGLNPTQEESSDSRFVSHRDAG